jgi:hypothetical protein
MHTTLTRLTKKPVALKFIVLIVGTVCLISVGSAASLRVREAIAAVIPGTLPTATTFDARGLDALAAQRPERKPSFTITWIRTLTTPDGQTYQLQTSTRSQRADGAYKLVHTFHDRDGAADRVEIVYGFLGLGVFRLDGARRQLVFDAPLTDEQPKDLEAYLRADPRFDRVEDVQGQRAIVWRTTTAADAGSDAGYAEDYRAPALGGLLIKQVEDSPRGRQVFEPTAIELGEPAAGLFAELYEYPADYARYEQSIEREERGQQHDTARLMRELVRRMKTVKPGRR